MPQRFTQIDMPQEEFKPMASRLPGSPRLPGKLVCRKMFSKLDCLKIQSKTTKMLSVYPVSWSRIETEISRI